MEVVAMGKKREVLLRRWEASAYLKEKHGLRRSPATLAKDACSSTGPPFRYINRLPYYWPAGLDSWVKTAGGLPRVRTQKYSPPRRRSRQEGTTTPTVSAPEPT
jgi:hypothetical protein